MIKDAELREEFEQDMCIEGRLEELLHNDYDYALEHFNFSDEMTLKEFREAVNMLNEYWEVDACELIRELV
jgi:hypothetical protein